MIIHVDMDNTANDFSGGFVTEFNRITGANFVLPREDHKEYEIFKNIPGIVNGDGLKIRERIFTTPKFWENLEPMPDFERIMKLACDKYKGDAGEVYILTAAWPTYEDCWTEKVRWVKKVIPFFDPHKIIFSWNKSIIKGDILIDDSPKYLETFNGDSVAYDWPYNRHLKIGQEIEYRVRNWEEIGRYLRV
jgi:5'-nucleotidase